MQYRILGELEITGDNGGLRVAAARQQVVIAVLLLEANRAVSTDRLIDAVWGERPPSTARGQIQICVSALRQALARVGLPDAIVTRGPGYLIQVPDDELDLQLFDRLVADGRAAVAEHRLADSAESYGRALRLWRGMPFAGIDSQLIQTAATNLVERHLAIVEESVDVRLDLGRHHELVGELMTLAAEHPVRERLCGQLMTALYRDGRQAEALDVYRRARQIFVDELGLEPGSALQRLERSILTGDPDLDGYPASGGTSDRIVHMTAVPQLLPVDISDFTGHDELLEDLHQFLAAGTGPGQLPIVAISGKGGVGKTTLAVHIAHHLMDMYPDGQLYVLLRGNEPLPVSPARALERFLRALGVPGTAIPDGVDERAEMYRNRLAGRRTVVVLDDAASETQVTPLLPGLGMSAVIVTSRLRLTRLPGAHRVNLEVLDSAPAVQLLGKVAGAERVLAEPTSARSLVRQCGGLPLALRLAGARLAARPHWTLARLVARLEDERRRLDELTHAGVDIRSTIAVAYTGLPASAKRLFRQLGMLEVTGFDMWVAAPLLDTSGDEAEDVLETLVDAQLLDAERINESTVRYRFHDLIRVYARERLATEDTTLERQAALRRVMGAWLYLAREAHRREYGGDFTVLHGTAELYPLEATVVEPLLKDPLEWYERERAGLVAAARHSADAGLDELCWDLAMSSVTLFETRVYHEDWRETHVAALAATQRAGNRRGEAAMLYSLGALRLVQQRYDEAEQLLARSLATFSELGDGHGCGLAQRNLGYVQRIRGDIDGALATYEQALSNVTAAGDVIAHAHVLSNMARLYLQQEQYAKAGALLDAALESARRAGAKRVEAQVLYRLGESHLRQDNLLVSSEAFRSVLAVVSLVKDPVGEAYALHGLGVVNSRLGLNREAESMLRRAHLLAQEAGDGLLQAEVLLAQSDVCRILGREAEALDRATAARDLCGQLGAHVLLSRADHVVQELEAATG